MLRPIIFLLITIALGTASTAQARDRYQLNPENPASVRTLVRAYLWDQMDVFVETPTRWEGPVYFANSLVEWIPASSHGSLHSRATAVWALGEITAKYLRKSVHRPYPLMREPQEQDRIPLVDRYIHAQLRKDISNEQETGGRIFQVLKAAAQSSEFAMAQAGTLALQRIVDTLVQIALEQGKFAVFEGPQSEHIERAIGMLEALGEPGATNFKIRKMAVEGLLAINRGTPGRTEPPRGYGDSPLRQELAPHYTSQALARLALLWDSAATAKLCAQFLTQVASETETPAVVATESAKLAQ